MIQATKNYFTFLWRCARIAFIGDWRYYAWMGVLTGFCLLGLNAYAKQLVHGLVVTGMSDEVSWGVYIANFTFLVGVAAVVDDAEAMLRRALHRLRGLRVAGEVDAALARLVADRRDFFLGVGELLRAARRERVVAREQELDRVDAGFRHVAHIGAQRVGAAGVALVGLEAERAIG